MRILSKRCETLRNDAVHIKSHAPCMELERLRLFNCGVLHAERKDSNAYLTASGTAAVIKNAHTLIQDGELIVGHNYGLGDYPSNPGSTRMLLNHIKLPDDEIKRLVTETDMAVRVRQLKNDAPPAPHPMSDLLEDFAITGFPVCDNHTVLGYEKVLRLGFEGLLDAVQRFSRQNGCGAWYDAVSLVCEAACVLGERYAEKAEELIARGGMDGERERELGHIARTCRQVPRYPARTFHEAVQSLWFAHIINTWEDGINANSLGRLDQILYPYYKADVEKGLLSEDEAFELICCLWIKLYRDYDVQQSCVGGCDGEGKPAVNALSYLMLDATEALDFVRCLSVRFSSETEKAFIERSLEVVGHVQKGIPFFFNDDVIIPALTAQGVGYQDALDYTQIGCVETVIPGKSNPHAVSSRANFLKAIEYVMHNGHSGMRPDLTPGLPTGDPNSFHTFEELKEAVYKQIKHMIQYAYLSTLAVIPDFSFNTPKPYKSLLTDGCLESGRDFNSGGAKYDYYQMMFFGIPNLADSLAAVRTLVYERKMYSLDELAYQLENDYPDEAFRLDFIHKAPKYGNDIAEVDDLAAEIMETGCDCLKSLSDEYGYVFQAQPFTFLWMIDHGKTTAATPDGRRRGEIMAYSMSPMQGRDFNGFTALMNSLSRLPTKKAAGTTSAIVEVEPVLFSDENISRFADILLVGARKGLSNVQFNVIDAETLVDAQKIPDKYRNLAVRVSGFSQKFYLLDKTMQDHIIGRTKHGSL